jgi:hypothetical protein
MGRQRTTTLPSQCGTYDLQYSKIPWLVVHMWYIYVVHMVVYMYQCGTYDLQYSKIPWLYEDGAYLLWSNFGWHITVRYNNILFSHFHCKVISKLLN